MRLWTIQHPQVYKTLLEKGEYFTDKSFICEDFFLPAYTWLVSEAQNKIPSWKNDRAIWFWDKKPDLRRDRWVFGQNESNLDQNLIEIEADPKLCLRSDFDLWHCALNLSIIDESPECEELDAFLKKRNKQKGTPFENWPEDIRQELYTSWRKHILREQKIEGETHQIIKEKIILSEVIKVTPFQYKNRKKF